MSFENDNFIINIDDIETECKKEVYIEDSIEIPKSYSPYNKVPFVLKGELERAKEGFRFSGSLKAQPRLLCDLCLSEFSKTIEFPVFGIFDREEHDSEDACYVFEDSQIDLELMIRTEILLNFPMKNVCRPDCKGLCPKCGKNLNEGDCGCQKGEMNPEFEKLLSMFNDKQD